MTVFSVYVVAVSAAVVAGEYEFTLTSAHGVSSGKYILCIRNAGNYTQSVRCKMKLRPYVQVGPLVLRAHEWCTT